MNTASELTILFFIGFVIFHVVYIPIGTILNVASRLISRLLLWLLPSHTRPQQEGERNTNNDEYSGEEHGHDSCCGVTVIVPAFLDNEITVIEKTLKHLLSPELLERNGPMQIILAYNNSQQHYTTCEDSNDCERNDTDGGDTAKPINTDTSTPPPSYIDLVQEQKAQLLRRLSILEERQKNAMRGLECCCVVESTSKAENLNEACKRAKNDLLVIYDADNIPEVNSMTRLYKTLSYHNADMVQGHTYQSFFGSNDQTVACCFFIVRQILISIFHYIATQIICPSLFLINFPRDWCWSLTGQANVMMRRQVMEEVPFDKNFVVEDVDFSLRVQTKKFRVRYCNTSQVAEQTPGSFYDFYKVQVRYYKGMEQVYKGIVGGRYGSRFPVGLWFGIHPALQITLVMNFFVWPALLFYHIFVKPLGDSLAEWGMNNLAGASDAINILMQLSMNLNLGVVMLLLYPLDFVSMKPQYFSAWEMFRQCFVFVVTYPFFVVVMFGGVAVVGTFQAKLSIAKGEVPEFNCTPRFSRMEEEKREKKYW